VTLVSSIGTMELRNMLKAASNGVSVLSLIVTVKCARALLYLTSVRLTRESDSGASFGLSMKRGNTFWPWHYEASC
jgi:hypothetical protein